MAEVWFYHLERQTLDEVLPALLERSLERGWRCVVQAGDAATRDHLDRHLWTYKDDSFLPHGTREQGRAERQPIYLTTEVDNPNNAHVRFCVERAAPPDPTPYVRLVLLFSAEDHDAVALARAQWRPLKNAGHACTYWQQTVDGRWVQKG